MIENRDRAAEMDKALLMAKLFQKKFFEPITDMIEQVSSKKATAEMLEPKVIEICAKADIDKENAIWLWNYLSKYDAKKSGNPPNW
jgi:hypothetical protein